MVRPSVPAPEAERGPSLWSLTPLEISPGLPPQLPPRPRPRPFRGDPTPPPSVHCPQDPVSPILRPSGPRVGAGAARHLPPTPAHPAGRPWREETPHRTGELGTRWGADGDPGGRGQRSPAAFGRSKAQADWMELQFPSAASLGCLSRSDGGCSPLCGGGGLGGGGARLRRCVLRVTF